MQVFWCEPVGRVRRWLRCYRAETHRQGDDPGPCGGYCNAMRFLDEIDEELGPPIEDGRQFRVVYDPTRFPWDAFPTACEKCGREMTEPTRQVFTDEVLEVRTGPRAGERFARREAPVGAMWEITHYRDIPDWCGRDGIALNVVTPGGEWSPDSMANNCTKRDDTTHRCWVRHGDPRSGYCHVDKDGTKGQPTCAAGAGSIWINKGGPRDWHGFLHRGYLVDADGDGRAVVDRMLDAGNPVAPAERVLKPAQLDRPVTVRPVVPPPLRRPMTFAEALAKRRERNAATGMRSNRGYGVPPKR